MRGGVKGLVGVGILVGCVIMACGATQAQPAPPEEIETMRRKMETVRREAEAKYEQHLEKLRAINPELYREQKRRHDQQNEIRRLVTAFAEKRLTADAAERKLYPLVKAKVSQELAAIDERIARAQEYVKELKRFKRDPGLLVQKRIDRLLGRMEPDEEPFGLLLP